MKHRDILALALTMCFASLVSADNWPAWRGPHGTGVAPERKAPLRWSAEKNVAWKVEMPGEGNSTPVVWGDQVFVSCAEDGGRLRSLLCFARADGKQLWQKTVEYSGKEKTHKTNPYCSSSPVTDGQRVVVWHGSAGLFCYDLDGNELWKRDLGEFDHIWGNASSPVIHENLVLLNAGPGLRTFLMALNKETGDEVWRRTVPDATSVKVDEFRGSWSTPVAFEQDGKTLFALSMPNRLITFDPRTGESVWFCRGVSKLSYTSPLVGEEIIVAMSGYHGPAIAVRKGGTGDVTDSHLLWVHDKKNPQRVGSGVLVGGYVYILNENGIAWCIDAATGEKKWEERLGGRAWSSMSHVDGRLYVSNQDGTTFVLEPTPDECKVLAENHLDELTRASHAFADGQIFIRTYQHLWCVGE